MRVTDGIWAAAATRPAAVALVVDGQETWRYGELRDAISRLGAGLRQSGLPRGGRLAICLPNGSPHLLAFCAAARYGWVAVPLPPGAAGTDLAALLRAARPDGVVAAPAWFARHRAVLTAAAPTAAPFPWAELLGCPGPPPDPAAPADPFYIGYTSGSTGRPKGVVRRHAAWVHSFAAATRELGLDAADRFWVPGPLAFSASLFAACHLLEVGGTVYLETRFTPRRGRERLADAAITGAFMVPTLYEALLSGSPRDAGSALTAPALRLLISCGEKLRPELRAELQRRCPAAAIYEYYGSSELGFTTLLPPAWAHRPAAAGRTFAGVEVAIRRPDGSPAPPGAVGLLYARSSMIAAGYDGADGTLLPLADADGWATAGDLARVDGEGLVWLCGRVDDAVNAGGAKVYPAEVEAVLLAHPAVAAAAAFGRSHLRRGEELVAAVAPRPDATLSRTELRAWCAEHLAPHKRPRTILVLPALPRTPAGKVDRGALRERLGGGLTTIIEGSRRRKAGRRRHLSGQADDQA